METWRTQVYDLYLSAHYHHYNRLDQTGYQQAAEMYDRIWGAHLPPDRNTRCLDLGCGTGRFLYYLRQKGYADTMGIDLSLENVTLAQSYGLDVTHCNAIEFMSSAQASGRQYDLVAIFDVLEHLTRPELFELLYMTGKVLAPQGRLLIKTLNASSLIIGSGRYMDITHEGAFTDETLRQICSCTGFARLDVVLTRGKGAKSFLRYWAKNCVYWILYRLLEGRRVPVAKDLDLFAVVYQV